MKPKSSIQQALSEQSNLAVCGLAMAASAAFLTPVPLLAGLVYEAGYLLFVPDSPWYAKRLLAREDAAVAARRKKLEGEIVEIMIDQTRKDYRRLTAQREELLREPPDDEKWFREVLRKLDYLLEKYLIFAKKESEFSEYLCRRMKELEIPYTLNREGHVNEGALDRAAQYYARETKSLEEDLRDEQDFNTRAVLQKRLELHKARSEAIPRLAKTLSNITHQLNLIEDTFGFISDELQARSPSQVLSDIETVVSQTESMTQLLDQMAIFEQH